MKYEISEKEDVAVVILKGEMKAGPDMDRLHDKIKEIVRNGIRKMVIDLGDAELMDSRGVAILVVALTSLRNVSGDLKLARVPDKIKQLIFIVDSPFIQRSFASVDESLKSFQPSS